MVSQPAPVDIRSRTSATGAVNTACDTGPSRLSPTLLFILSSQQNITHTSLQPMPLLYPPPDITASADYRPRSHSTIKIKLNPLNKI